MKEILLLLLLTITASSFAQQSQEQLRKKALEGATDYKMWDSLKIINAFNKINISKPTANKTNKICLQVETQEFDYENTLYEVSGVTKEEKGTVIGILKVQKFWSLYKDSCQCNTEGFSLKNGNVSQLAVTANFIAFLDGLVRDFGISINYKDKLHNLTVLDFTLNEIKRLEEANEVERVAGLKSIYEYLKKELGCKHGWEL